MKIVERPYQEPHRQALVASGMHPLLARIYAARSIRSAAELAYTPAGLLPPTLKGIEQAAALLADAIQAGKRLLIIADYDADGATACAVGMRALRLFGANVDYLVPDRFKLVPPLILTTCLAVSPVWHGYDHVLLLPSALLAFRWGNEYFQLKPFGRAVLIFSIFVFAWSWISAITLYLTSRGSPALAQSLVLAPLYAAPFSPLCALASLVLIGRERLLRASSGAPA